MKKTFLLLILLTLNIWCNAQKRYEVDMIGEKHFYNQIFTPFKDFIQKFTKNDFKEATETNILNTTKITVNDLKKYQKIILENIPKDSENHIWVVYGYRKGNYYSKYQFKKKISEKKKDFFLQINYHVNKKNNLIDSISFCIPKNGCNQIKKYKPNNPIKHFEFAEMQKNNFPVDNSYNLQKYEENKKKMKEDSKAIWIEE